jgi:hypothetical protein
MHWLESRRAHNHILLSHLRLSQPGGLGFCIYIPQEQGGPVIPPDIILSAVQRYSLHTGNVAEQQT